MSSSTSTTTKPRWIPPPASPKGIPPANTFPAEVSELPTGPLVVFNRRLKRLEIDAKRLPWDEKWPTEIHVQLHRERQAHLAQAEHGMSGGAASQPSCYQIPKPINTANCSDFPFQVSQAGNPKKFELFGELPTELRLQIWGLATLFPQFIEVQRVRSWAEWTIFDDVTHFFHATSPLFRTCRESRFAALEIREHGSERYLNPTMISRNRNKWKDSARTLGSHLGLSPTHFLPTRDTLFFRTSFGIDDIIALISRLQRQFPHFTTIQHLALPYDVDSPLPSAEKWQEAVLDWPGLRTITLMLGCKEKSWMGEAGIELRDLEQWFVDGRKRMVTVKAENIVMERGLVSMIQKKVEVDVDIDIKDLGTYMMSGEDQHKRIRNMIARRVSFHNAKMAELAKRVVKVRVVAWKRGL